VHRQLLSGTVIYVGVSFMNGSERCHFTYTCSMGRAMAAALLAAAALFVLVAAQGDVEESE
jgi:hypothetical protein